MRLVPKEGYTLCFVSFMTAAQAQFVSEALNGYVFDEEAPPNTHSMLTLQVAKQRMKRDTWHPVLGVAQHGDGYLR